jgi:hypothetical protein
MTLIRRNSYNSTYGSVGDLIPINGNYHNAALVSATVKNGRQN